MMNVQESEAHLHQPYERHMDRLERERREAATHFLVDTHVRPPKEKWYTRAWVFPTLTTASAPQRPNAPRHPTSPLPRHLTTLPRQAIRVRDTGTGKV